jgi:micrococcal nuclease
MKFQDLELQNIKDAELFSLNGNVMLGKCNYVTDGDTIHVIFKIFNTYMKFKIRLYGIDTPEIRTNDEEEKKRGYDAKEFVQSMVLNKLVLVRCYNFDNFGRLLADIYIDDICLNTILLEKNMAKKYE